MTIPLENELGASLFVMDDEPRTAELIRRLRAYDGSTLCSDWFDHMNMLRSTEESQNKT